MRTRLSNSRGNVALIALVVLLIAGGVGLVLVRRQQSQDKEAAISNFDECAAAGHPIMESYPAQCMTSDGRSFTQNVDMPAMDDMPMMDRLTSAGGETIVVDSPEAGDTITSPLTVTGQIPGSWSFEGSFPIVLKTHNGDVVARGTGKLQDDWMTEELVDFTATLTFATPAHNAGVLILEKDNPSGLATNDDSVRIKVSFKL